MWAFSVLELSTQSMWRHGEVSGLRGQKSRFRILVGEQGFFIIIESKLKLRHFTAMVGCQELKLLIEKTVDFLVPNSLLILK